MAGRDPESKNAVRMRFAVALICVALGAAAFAIGFRAAIGIVFTRVLHAPDVLAAFRALPWPARIILPTVGGGLAGYFNSLSSRGSEEGGRGVGEVMEAVVLGNSQLSIPRTILKAVGSWFAIISGGSIGREGSIIQFGGGFGAFVSRVFGMVDVRRRSLIAAGSAAGFAAAYNTPLAAVLFVVEVVTGVVALDIVLPVIVATPIATAATRFVIGGGPIYGERAFSLVSDYELGPFASLGLLAGLCGPAFMALLATGESLFGKLPVPKAARAALGGLAVGLFAMPLPEITGNGYEVINLILSDRIGIGMLLVLALAKPLATVLSVSSGSPGGVFTPSLFIGAALGGMVGRAAPLLGLVDASQAGAYALVGMAAMSAATTHAPLMAAVMVFELSGDYGLVVPLLVATGCATLVSRSLRRLSIYGEELERSGTSWDITLEGRRLRHVKREGS